MTGRAGKLLPSRPVLADDAGESNPGPLGLGSPDYSSKEDRMNKDKALQIMDNRKKAGALVFARREEVEEISQQYEPVVTVLELDPSHFADVGMGNMYPMKSATNQIADAAGVSFTSNCGTKEKGSWADVKVTQEDGVFTVSGDYAIVGWAQGQRLKPDGKTRLSSVREYEFNVVDRANLDFISDAEKSDRKRYRGLAQARKHLLELKKFATQRASTGAQLAVIRELAGVPTAFKKDQIDKPMLFSQIIESNKYKVDMARELMQSSDGRQAVANSLFGTTQNLYGGGSAQIEQPRDVSPEKENEDMTYSGGEESFEDGWEEPQKQEESDPKENLLTKLEEYMHSGMMPPKGLQQISAAIDNPEAYSVEDLQDLVDRAHNAYQKRTGGAA